MFHIFKWRKLLHVIFCVLPSAELLDTVKASMWIVTGNVSHTKGEYPHFISIL